MTAVDDKLNFRIEKFQGGIYDVVNAIPLGSLQTSVTSGGGNSDSFVFPLDECLDLYNTILTFSWSGVAAGSEANWLYSNHLPFRRIRLRYGSDYLLDLSDAYIYINAVCVAAKRQSQAEQYDKVYGSDATSHGVDEFLRVGTLNRGVTYDTISVSSATSTYSAYNPNFTTDNMVNFGVATALTSYPITNANIPRDQGREITYLFNASSVNEASPTIIYRVRLGDVLAGTVFSSIKQDFYNKEGLILTIDYEGTSKLMFKNSNTSTFSQLSAFTGSATLASQALWVPVQRDERIKEQIKSAYDRGGIKYCYDYPIIQQTDLTATSHNIQMNIPRGTFKTIKALLFTGYHGTQSGSTSFDHRMDESTSIKKIVSFYTQLNGRRLESQLLNTADFDDWMLMKNRLAGSVVMLSSSVYKYNWIFGQSFGKENIIDAFESNDLQGLDGDKNNIYSIQATAGTSRNIKWYIFAIGQKIMKVTAGGTHSIVTDED